MIVTLLGRLRRDKKGQSLVEYGLIIAGVALITAAAISVFGHKTNDMVAATAAILPGAHSEDNGPIASGALIETTSAENGNIALDVASIQGQQGKNQPRLGNNVRGTGATGNEGFGGLVVEPAAAK